MRMTDASLSDRLAGSSRGIFGIGKFAGRGRSGQRQASQLRHQSFGSAELEFQRSKSLFCPNMQWLRLSLIRGKFSWMLLEQSMSKQEALLKNRMAAITGSAGTVQQAYGKLNAAETGPKCRMHVLL